MSKLASLLMMSTLATLSWSQTASTQTARQALLEMFFSKTSGTLVKHLPAATLTALDNAGALKTLQQYSALDGQFHNTGNQLETFETGSVLLSTFEPKTGQKVEITVESDSLQGDDNNIELSFRTYKQNQLQKTPFMPRITFAMKMEGGVWKLNEILVSVRIPLADPDFLKSITDGIKSRAAAAAAIQTQPAQSATTFGSDSTVIAAMRTILAAENTYSTTYRNVGYTCTLSDLDGFGGGEANEHQAMLIPSGLAGGKKFGYIFTLSGCTGTPATGVHLTASPAGNVFGRRAFCADRSGVIRYSTDGNPATCLASGMPVQ
jgi:hypothetical protein